MSGYDLARFLKTTLPEELICSLCRNIMKDPIMCKNNSTWLCLECSKAACSIGKEKRDYTDINKFIKNKIDEYQIKCKYFIQGCPKIAKIKEMEKHEETCLYAKMKEKKYEMGNVSEVSKFNSEQCPTSKIKCHICRIEMQITEKHQHNCIDSLLSLIQSLQRDSKAYTESNIQILAENKDLEEKLNNLTISGKKEAEEITQNINYLKTERIPYLEDQLKTHIEKRESIIESKVNEYYNYVDNKYDAFLQKTQKEIESVKKNIDKTIDNYQQNVKSSLSDFNMKVHADAIYLTTIPTDMKDYDESPLRKKVVIKNEKATIY